MVSKIIVLRRRHHNPLFGYRDRRAEVVIRLTIRGDELEPFDPGSAGFFEEID
jgi:hypothetical protein